MSEKSDAWDRQQDPDGDIRRAAREREVSEYHARFEILPESNVGLLVIRDLGPWDQCKTVTNDAEHVVKLLFEQGYLHPGRKLHYFDSGGQRDEIQHDGHGHFRGFVHVTRD